MIVNRYAGRPVSDVVAVTHENGVRCGERAAPRL